MYNDEKLDLIIEELHEIAMQLKNYNRIGTELLEIQRRMFNPMDMGYERQHPFNERPNFNYREYRY